MAPNIHKPRFVYGHDKEGYVYKIRVDDKGKEVSRVKLNQKIVWAGVTADLGIRAFKRAVNHDPDLVRLYKQNVWRHPSMIQAIESTALKEPEEKTEKSA